MMKQLLCILFFGIVGLSPAFAISLDEAKDQGLVGERIDGYLGYVTSSPSGELKALVKDVNNKRKAKFSDAATKHKLTVKQVGQLFYERAVKETDSGHFYQSPGGSWVKK